MNLQFSIYFSATKT